jgi:hypothetical protein
MVTPTNRSVSAGGVSRPRSPGTKYTANCVLAWLVLESAGAPAGARLLFTAGLAGLFAASFVSLVRRPDVVVLGYKG